MNMAKTQTPKLPTRQKRTTNSLVKAFRRILRKRRNRFILIILLLLALAGLYYAQTRLVHDRRDDVQDQTVGVTQPNHQSVRATMFWVGEPPDEDNANITNVASAWTEDWVKAFGGIDSPDKRCGYKPCSFEPKENPFYFALPYNDYAADGDLKPNSELKRIPWFSGPAPAGMSLLKNRWIAVTLNGKTAYAQWEDVGPMHEDDVDYVFGDAKPKYRAGLDLSPAMDNYLGLGGEANVSWKFVEASDVPDGPWKALVTTSGLDYSN